MGLAGRKSKQRIGPDPRNTSWSDDASKFGQSYLEKFGWSSGTGLGANADGMTSNIKVMRKLDLMGIGAGRTREGDEGGQGREFEQLLKRLNAGNQSQSLAAEVDEKGSVPVSGDESTLRDTQPRKKKRKTLKSEEAIVAEVAPEVVQQPKVYAPRPMAHRAKFLKSKKLASSSEASINEILGISSSATTTRSTSSISTPLLTDPNTPSSSTPPLTDPGTDDDRLISTSSKSLADYFAEKLASKKSKPVVSSPLITPATENNDDLEPDEKLEKKEKSKKKRKKSQIEDVCDGEVPPQLPQNEHADTFEHSDEDRSRKKKKKKEQEQSTEAPPADENDDPASEHKKKKKKRKDDQSVS